MNSKKTDDNKVAGLPSLEIRVTKIFYERTRRWRALCRLFMRWNPGRVNLTPLLHTRATKSREFCRRCFTIHKFRRSQHTERPLNELELCKASCIRCLFRIFRSQGHMHLLLWKVMTRRTLLLTSKGSGTLNKCGWSFCLMHIFSGSEKKLCLPKFNED